MDLRNELASLSTSPRKILKIVIALSAVLLLIWLFMLLKMDSQTNKKVELQSSELTEQQGTIDSTNTVFSGKQQGLTTRSAESEEGESSLFGNAFITFLVLILLLAGVWYWSDKGQVSTVNNHRRVLDSEAMGDGATLQIVEVNNEVWVLGVTSSSIDLLHRYNEDEWKEEMPVQSPKGGNFLEMFKDGLS